MYARVRAADRNRKTLRAHVVPVLVCIVAFCIHIVIVITCLQALCLSAQDKAEFV